MKAIEVDNNGELESLLVTTDSSYLELKSNSTFQVKFNSTSIKQIIYPRTDSIISNTNLYFLLNGSDTIKAKKSEDFYVDSEPG
ncbi:MAG: hypothetical protein JST26_19270 [Bacteroidetes bacterium]|nr:hypothetical protein [Bacteroidota bacterium]